MSSNKSIAQNTIYLYVRLIFTIGVSLITSRIIVDALGFADYGIYVVVAGIVGLISFMHTSLAGATTRFMNIEMGKKNIENLKSVFNSALIIHFSLAILLFIIAETAGLWYIYNKLNIPESRFFAAHVVYQLSVASIMISIVQIPYDAAIIAHQRMSAFAYISIIEVSLKLAIAYAVYVSFYDKLITYAVLVLLVSIIVRMIYSMYCYKNFEECRFKWVINKTYLTSISSFFGWDLFGHFSLVAKNQGIQLVLNSFFGTVINASSGIATTISGMITGFAGNFSIAARPQIMQYYAEGNIEEMFRLLNFSARLTFYLISIFAVIFFIESDFFLGIWLKSVPPFTSVFCKLILIQITFSRLYTPLNDVMHATGEIKYWSFYGGCVNVFNLIATYIVVEISNDPVHAYVVGIFCVVVSFFINIYYTKKNVSSFLVKDYLYKICLRCILVLLIGALPGVLLSIFLPNDFIFVAITVFVTLFFYTLSIYFIGLNGEEKKWLSEKVRSYIKFN